MAAYSRCEATWARREARIGRTRPPGGTVVMKRRLVIAFGFVAIGRLVAAGVQAVEPGFTSLFDGKTFNGWKFSGPASAFTIQDGVIVANSVTGHAYYDGAFRNHSFRNFELKVDIKTHAGSNGGVYVLTEYEAVGGNVRPSGNF